MLTGIIIGYIACIVLPCPYLSRVVLRQWSNLGAWVRGRV
jgi:hypothetical protein